MLTYVTFGQVHTHVISGKVFDKDCIAVIDAVDKEEGRAKAFEYFGDKFFTTYTENNFNLKQLRFFSRGLIEVN